MTKDYIVKQLNYYGYAELATNISSYTGKLADIPWFTTQKDADGNDIQVPSDVSLVSYGMFHPNMRYNFRLY